VWWVDPGWTPGAHKGALSLSLLSWTRERKYNERLKGSWVQIRTWGDQSSITVTGKKDLTLGN